MCPRLPGGIEASPWQVRQSEVRPCAGSEISLSTAATKAVAETVISILGPRA